MKNRKIIFLAYGVILLLVPIYVIYVSTDILNNGKLYKFRPVAYDPVDPLRGNYLDISYRTFNIPTNDEFEGGDEVFVSIGVDKDGYAFFEEAFKSPPKKGDYICTEVLSQEGREVVRDGIATRINRKIRRNDVGDYKRSVSIKSPNNMNKYFLNENKGRDAERAFNKHRRDSYVGVRIKNGHLRLQDIYIKKKPLKEFLKTQ